MAAGKSVPTTLIAASLPIATSKLANALNEKSTGNLVKSRMNVSQRTAWMGYVA
jgi:hypothetical protein